VDQRRTLTEADAPLEPHGPGRAPSPAAKIVSSARVNSSIALTLRDRRRSSPAARGRQPARARYSPSAASLRAASPRRARRRASARARGPLRSGRARIAGRSRRRRVRRVGTGQREPRAQDAGVAGRGREQVVERGGVEPLGRRDGARPPRPPPSSRRRSGCCTASPPGRRPARRRAPGGRARLTAARRGRSPSARPPTMIVSVADSAPRGPPLTGASSAASKRSASCRASAGGPVDMSTRKTSRGSSAATRSTISGAGSERIATSAPSAASAAAATPLNSRERSGSTSHPTTSCPAATRCRAIGSPIVPSPMKATLKERSRARCRTSRSRDCGRPLVASATQITISSARGASGIRTSKVWWWERTLWSCLCLIAMSIGAPAAPRFSAAGSSDVPSTGSRTRVAEAEVVMIAEPCSISPSSPTSAPLP